MSVEISNFLCLRKAEWYQTGKVSLGHGACQGKGAPEQGINYMAHTKKTNANACHCYHPATPENQLIIYFKAS